MSLDLEKMLKKKKIKEEKVQENYKMIQVGDLLLSKFLQDFLNACFDGKDYVELNEELEGYLKYLNIRTNKKRMKLNHYNIKRIYKVFEEEIAKETKINNEIRGVNE